MKLVRRDGQELEVREVSEPVYRLAAGAVPIRLHGWRLLEDEEARQLVRGLAKVQSRPAVEATAENASAQDRPICYFFQ